MVLLSHPAKVQLIHSTLLMKAGCLIRSFISVTGTSEKNKRLNLLKIQQTFFERLLSVSY